MRFFEQTVKIETECYNPGMSHPPLFLGADHAGFELKESLKAALQEHGYTLRDLSPTCQPDDDYPEHARRVARAVAKMPGSRGILVCGSGIGVSIAANRIKGIRAFDAHDEDETILAREHTDANIIAFSGWRFSPKDAYALLMTFLSTPASRAARHVRRRTQLG